ncbi:MAG: hypothetical protein ACK5LL_16215 [Suipraeoptans sp.]
MGVGHISTVINPGWCGRPLIAVNNPTDNEICIDVGVPFVIMLLDYLNTPSTTKVDAQKSSRLDVLHGYQLSKEQEKLIYHDDIQRAEILHKHAKDKKAYEEIKKTKQKQFNGFIWLQGLVATISIGVIIWATITSKTQWTTLPVIFVTAIATNLVRKFIDRS